MGKTRKHNKGTTENITDTEIKGKRIINKRHRGGPNKIVLGTTTETGAKGTII